MEAILVAKASAFFQEKGLDANGIFRLLFNALNREFVYYYSSADGIGGFPSTVDFPYTYLEAEFSISAVSMNISKFTGNLDFAKQRVEQFFADYKRLKSLDEKISQLGFWDYLLRRKNYVKEIFRERRKLLNMRITVVELLEVAYYKYTTENLGSKDDFLRDLKNFIGE